MQTNMYKFTKRMRNIPVIFYMIGAQFCVLSSVPFFGALYVARIEWPIMVKAPASNLFAQF